MPQCIVICSNAYLNLTSYKSSPSIQLNFLDNSAVFTSSFQNPK